MELRTHKIALPDTRARRERPVEQSSKDLGRCDPESHDQRCHITCALLACESEEGLIFKTFLDLGNGEILSFWSLCSREGSEHAYHDTHSGKFEARETSSMDLGKCNPQNQTRRDAHKLSKGEAKCSAVKKIAIHN